MDTISTWFRGCILGLGIVPLIVLPSLASDVLRSPRSTRAADLEYRDRPVSTQQITAQTPATPAAAESSATLSYPAIPARGGLSFTSGPGVGYDSSFGSLEGFIPLLQTPGKNIGFVQGRFSLDTRNANPSGNVILGYRAFNPQSRSIFGGYFGFDSRSTGNSTFHQLGAGVEALFSGFEARLNGYLPIGDRSNLVAESSSISAPRFRGNFLVLDTTTRRLFETSLAGFDAEAGVKLVQWSAVGSLKSYLGLYSYSGDRVDGFVGVRGRLEAQITENIRAGLTIQGDREFGTTAVVTVGVLFPGLVARSRPSPQTDWVEAGNSVFRQNAVAVTQRTTNTLISTPLLNPITNQPWLFQQVILGGSSGNGTIENPFGTVASSLAATRGDGNDIVYVQTGSNLGIPAFTIPSQVQVRSSGIVQTIATVQRGIVTLPQSGTGILPIVNGTVTLAAAGRSQVLSGFDVRSATIGITGTNIISPILADNRVTIAAANTVTSPNGRGILLFGANGSGINPVQIIRNEVRNAIGEGIRLDNSSGSVAINNNTVVNTIQPDVQTELEASILVRNNTGNIDLAIANNVIRDNTTLSSSPAIANEIDGIEVSICRVYSDFTACSSPTTATIAIANNTISTITSTGQNADGIDLNLGSGSITSSLITGNTVSNISDKGVSFGADGDARFSAVITNNTFNGMGEVGIQVRLGETAGATTDGLSPVTLNGITTQGVVITGNTIQNTGQSGIRLRTANNAQLGVTATNNTVNNANTTNDNNEAGILARTENTSRVCIRLQNNTSINPFSARDYRFRRQGGGAALELLGNGTAIAVANPSLVLESTLTAQGNVGRVNGFVVQNNTVQIPTASCSFP